MVKLSVLMPNYNGEEFLEEAINSILEQTYKDFEFIIVDDCSPDGSWKIIQEYARKDKRIKAFRNKKNLNVVKTRNKAFSCASKKTKHFAIFDSDDICSPNRLEKQVAFMEKHPEVAVVGAWTEIIDEKGLKVGLRKYPSDGREVAIFFSPLAQPTAVIRASALEDVGWYNEEFVRCQDYELWMRMLEKYEIANIQEVLLQYRVSSTQGKTHSLKLTLRNTLKIKRRWLFTQEWFSVKAMLYYYMEKILLVLPAPIILWLFKKVRYKK